jgi:hypothetical protein
VDHLQWNTALTLKTLGYEAYYMTFVQQVERQQCELTMFVLFKGAFVPSKLIPVSSDDEDEFSPFGHTSRDEEKEGYN